MYHSYDLSGKMLKLSASHQVVERY